MWSESAGRAEATSVIDALTDGVPAPLVELRKLGRTPSRRAADVLTYFERPRTSNGPTEAINGRLEHPRELRRTLSSVALPPLIEDDGWTVGRWLWTARGEGRQTLGLS